MTNFKQPPVWGSTSWAIASRGFSFSREKEHVSGPYGKCPRTLYYVIFLKIWSKEVLNIVVIRRKKSYESLVAIKRKLH